MNARLLSSPRLLHHPRPPLPAMASRRPGPSPDDPGSGDPGPSTPEQPGSTTSDEPPPDNPSGSAPPDARHALDAASRSRQLAARITRLDPSRANVTGVCAREAADIALLASDAHYYGDHDGVRHYTRMVQRIEDLLRSVCEALESPS